MLISAIPSTPARAAMVRTPATGPLSLRYLTQRQVLEFLVGHDLFQHCVLPFELLEPFHVVGLHPAVLIAPTVIGLLGHLRVPSLPSHVRALVEQPIGLSELAHNLFRRMPSSSHRDVMCLLHPAMLGNGLSQGVHQPQGVAPDAVRRRNDEQRVGRPALCESRLWLRPRSRADWCRSALPLLDGQVWFREECHDWLCAADHPTIVDLAIFPMWCCRRRAASRGWTIRRCGGGPTECNAYPDSSGCRGYSSVYERAQPLWVRSPCQRPAVALAQAR